MDDGLNGNEMRLNETHSDDEHRTTEVTCIICHEQKEQGIQICGQFLCTQCERDIVHSDVHDKRYQHYVDEMKRIWLSALSL